MPDAENSKVRIPLSKSTMFLNFTKSNQRPCELEHAASCLKIKSHRNLFVLFTPFIFLSFIVRNYFLKTAFAFFFPCIIITWGKKNIKTALKITSHKMQYLLLEGRKNNIKSALRISVYSENNF